MEYKQVLVREDLHAQVKAAAALAGKPIWKFVEEALLARLPEEPFLPFIPPDDDNNFPASP